MVLRLDVAEGVASDFWGDEFLLGGEAMTRISPPFSSGPLGPVDRGLTSRRPSPGLATRLAKLPTSDVSDSPSGGRDRCVPAVDLMRAGGSSGGNRGADAA